MSDPKLCDLWGIQPFLKIKEIFLIKRGLISHILSLTFSSYNEPKYENFDLRIHDLYQSDLNHFTQKRPGSQIQPYWWNSDRQRSVTGGNSIFTKSIPLTLIIINKYTNNKMDALANIFSPVSHSRKTKNTFSSESCSQKCYKSIAGRDDCMISCMREGGAGSQAPTILSALIF